MELKGKTALVTGGTDGIGLEIARQMMAKGASVIVCGRRDDVLASAQQEGLEAIKADLSNAAGCAELAAALAGRELDILINNAGMSGNFGPGEPLDLALTDQAIFLNLNAPLHLIGHLLPGLLQRPEASIVNVTSGLAIAPRAGGPVYCASKAGLRSFTLAFPPGFLEGQDIGASVACDGCCLTVTAHRDGHQDQVDLVAHNERRAVREVLGELQGAVTRKQLVI